MQGGAGSVVTKSALFFLARQVGDSCLAFAKRPDGATGSTFLRSYRSPDREPPMRSITPDEKQLVRSRLIKDLTRLRTDAGNLGLDMLAFIFATAQDEAQGQLQKLEGEDE